MTLLEFITKYFNQVTGNTPENTGECVGLIEKWIEELGLPHVWGHAKDLLSNAPKDSFKVIKNAIDNFPLAGDIVVWDKSWGGGFGHTGVVIAADRDWLDVFEQNNPGKPHLVHHINYSGVLGWFRPLTYHEHVCPTLSFNDQTKYDFGEGIGYVELGAMRSMYLDMRRDYWGALAQAQDIKRQFDEYKQKQSVVTYTLPHAETEQIEQEQASNLITDLFKWIFKK